jgi:hypothetical protein
VVTLHDRDRRGRPLLPAEQRQREQDVVGRVGGAVLDDDRMSAW